MIATACQSETLTTSVAVSGKLGEFLQGVDHEGNPFLYTATVTSPKSGTSAQVLPSPIFRVIVGNKTANYGFPPNTQKTERAIRSLLERKQIERPWDFEVRLVESPPSAKGLGASSSDMAASLLATARYLQLEVTEQELFSLMCSIERSDYLFLPDRLVCANPLSSEFSIKGNVPPLCLVAWDTEPNRMISTEEVAYLDHLRKAHASEYVELALDCDSGESYALLAASTRSAQINQKFLPKPSFNWALKVAKQNQAELVVAHSGTFMAFAVSRDTCDVDRLSYLQAILISNGLTPISFQTGAVSCCGI